jgi:hypothetical protein
MKLSAHPFEVPMSGELPPLFTGFLCVGFAGGKWWTGCDTNDSLDAYQNMVDNARCAMIPAATVDSKFDPSFIVHTVRVYRVEPD